MVVTLTRRRLFHLVESVVHLPSGGMENFNDGKSARAKPLIGDALQENDLIVVLTDPEAVPVANDIELPADICCVEITANVANVLSILSGTFNPVTEVNGDHIETGFAKHSCSRPVPATELEHTALLWSDMSDETAPSSVDAAGLRLSVAPP